MRSPETNAGPNKAAANRSHARRRYAERYGAWLTDGDLDALEAEILSDGPGAMPLRHDRKYENRTHYALRVEGRWVPAVWDEATSSIVTFPPERALDPYRNAIEPVLVPPPPPAPLARATLYRSGAKKSPSRQVPPPVTEVFPPTLAEAVDREREVEAEYRRRMPAIGEKASPERQAAFAKVAKYRKALRRHRQSLSLLSPARQGWAADSPSATGEPGTNYDGFRQRQRAATARHDAEVEATSAATRAILAAILASDDPAERARLEFARAEAGQASRAARRARHEALCAFTREEAVLTEAEAKDPVALIRALTYALTSRHRRAGGDWEPREYATRWAAIDFLDAHSGLRLASLGGPPADPTDD